MKSLRKFTAVALAIMLCLSMLAIGGLSASAFSADNFKAQIKEIHVGAPITSVESGKYLPVDVHFTANENLSNKDMVYFIEAYLKVKLKNGTLAEGITGLGMTLMDPVKPDVPLDNNMWSWNWKGVGEEGGEGVIKFNLPLLDEGDTQAVEKSGATGMEEVNGVKVGDEVTVQVSTVVNTSQFPPEVVQEVFPNGSEVMSDEASFAIEELLSYPRQYNITALDTTEPETEETTEATEATTETAETTGSTEPTTEAPETTVPETSAAVDATTEPVETTSPEVTTEPVGTTAPEVTTSPENTDATEATEATEGTTSGEVVDVETTQEPTGYTIVPYDPSTPDVKPTQEVVVDPTTQPSTEATTGEPATQPATQPATKAEPISIKDAKVSVAEAGAYDGKEKKPEITVSVGEKKLDKGTDFTVEYSNNKNAGKGVAVVTGKGSYKDSLEVEFKIAKAENTAKAKAKTVKLKAKRLKHKNRTFKPVKISSAKGKVKYKIVKPGKLKGKIKINKKGKVTIKKGTYKKGTYRFKVKATVKGNKNFKSKTITKKVKLKIT